AAALRAQDEALQTAKEALRLITINYKAGLNTYLDVLNADAQYHEALVNDLQSTAVRYQDTVALYVALGGGWWNAPHDGPSGRRTRTYPDSAAR
ncbi:MAG TPA: TolC family protein, partial [Steroidobacteraceae bacterium]|nr:TolC family protein [Steroidobacteraceae bacterium]